VAYGLIFSLWLCVVGGLIVVGGLFGWVLEPPDDPDAAHADHGPDDHASDDGSAAEGAGELPAAAADGDAAEKETEPVG
jgi:hypothetical protein